MTLEDNKLRQIEEIEALCAIFDNLVKVVDDRKFTGKNCMQIIFALTFKDPRKSSLALA